MFWSYNVIKHVIVLFFSQIPLLQNRKKQNYKSLNAQLKVSKQNSQTSKHWLFQICACSLWLGCRRLKGVLVMWEDTCYAVIFRWVAHQ